MDLQLFAEGEGGAAPPPASAPALSRAQQQQAERISIKGKQRVLSLFSGISMIVVRLS